MWVETHNLSAKLIKATPEEREWLSEYLSFPDDKAKFRRTPRWKTDSKIRMMNAITLTFPAGFVSQVEKAAKDAGIPIQVLDRRVAPCRPDKTALVDWLRPYQLEALEVAKTTERGVFRHPTGAGKCLALGTPVMLADGRVVPVEEVCVGDRLMGPEGFRTVLSTTRGTGPLYRITPNKGEPWVCNDVHVLTLIHTSTGKIVDVPLDEYLSWSRNRKHRHKLFKVPVAKFEHASEPLEVSPYFLGVWLGDGGKDLEKNGIRVSKADAEIVAACEAEARRFGLRVETDASKPCPTHRIVGKRGLPNPLTHALSRCVTKDLVVAQRYRSASWGHRAELLAGLLDTDGNVDKSGFEITQKRKPIADLVVWLARSLGLGATIRPKPVPGSGVYWRVLLSGDCDLIPTRIPRKRAPARRINKDACRTGFKVDLVGEGEYAGFTLDGDGRFLLGDFTVTHNTEVIVALAELFPIKWLVLTNRKELLGNTVERFARRTGEEVGVIGDGRFDVSKRVTTAMFQSLYAGVRSKSKKTLDFLKTIQGVMIDEVHIVPAATYWGVLMALENAYFRYGFSGTPFSRSDKKSIFTWGAVGPIIHRIHAETLIDAGVLAKPEIRLIRVEADPIETGSWTEAYRHSVVEAPRRNEAVVRAALSATKPCLVFVNHVAHGKILERAIRSAGTNVEFVWGKHHTGVRRAAIDRLTMGETDVLICNVIFQEGVDIPELQSVVIAQGGKSVISALQRVGRGMRRRSRSGEVTKDTFKVYDIKDVGCGCKNPRRHLACRWLEKHTRSRVAAYTSEKYAVVEEG